MTDPKRAHVVLAHPEAQSFNGLLARTTQSTLESRGWEVSESDLYRLGFDPCEGPSHYGDRAETSRFHAQTEQRSAADGGTTPADVAREMNHLRSSELLVVHFPLWWFGMPAMLKGWIDRVFVYGAMYRSQVRYDRGVCAGKRMLACVTTGASEDSCAFDGREGDTRMHLWPALFPFRYLGYDVFVPEIFHGVGGVAFVEGHDDETPAVDRYAKRWAEQLRSLDHRPTVAYNRDDEFDDRKRLRDGAPGHSPFVSHRDQTPWGGASG